MTTPIATVSALAAFTLFMIVALAGLGTSMDANPNSQVAAATAAQAQG